MRLKNRGNRDYSPSTGSHNELMGIGYSLEWGKRFLVTKPVLVPDTVNSVQPSPRLRPDKQGIMTVSGFIPPFDETRSLR